LSNYVSFESRDILNSVNLDRHHNAFKHLLCSSTRQPVKADCRRYGRYRMFCKCEASASKVVFKAVRNFIGRFKI